jgi:site-specific DNA recombinase
MRSSSSPRCCQRAAGGSRRDPREPGGDGRRSALGLITRAQLLAATGRGSARLAENGDLLADAARENVLAGLAAADDVAAAWQAMDSSRQRAVVTTLMDITLRSPGRGARRGFDPATVTIGWISLPAS